MKHYPVVKLPDDEPYHYWKIFPDTIAMRYSTAYICTALCCMAKGRRF